MADLTKTAALALRASIRLSSEIVGIVELPPALLSQLNRTATIQTMCRDIEAIQLFIAEIEKRGN